MGISVVILTNKRPDDFQPTIKSVAFADETILIRDHLGYHGRRRRSHLGKTSHRDQESDFFRSVFSLFSKAPRSLLRPNPKTRRDGNNKNYSPGQKRRWPFHSSG